MMLAAPSEALALARVEARIVQAIPQAREGSRHKKRVAQLHCLPLLGSKALWLPKFATQHPRADLVPFKGEPGCPDRSVSLPWPA